MRSHADRPRHGASSRDDAAPRPAPGKGGPDEDAGPGRPLPGALRADMERSFATSFADVRVREGGLARSLGAVAVARGDDLHFAPGAFDPGSAAGREVIGHELAHVVQQRQGRVTADAQAKGLPTSADPGLEAEADALGARAARGEVVAHAPTPATGVAGPAQCLREDKGAAEEIDIATLGYEACVHYLAEAAKGAETAVVFEAGDVQQLRERLAVLRGGSVLATKAGPAKDRQIATEVLLNPDEPARHDDERLGQLMVGGDPLDCGSTAGLLGGVFLGGEAHGELNRHHSVAARASEKEVGITNATANANAPTRDPRSIGLVQGTDKSFGQLATQLRESSHPMFIQMAVRSVPAALGHTFVIEVLGRRATDEPVLGKVHQSFVNTYPLHAWLGDPKNGIIDVLAYLGDLAGMCDGGRMDTYLDKFLMSEDKGIGTANRKRGEFAAEHARKTYAIGISYASQPFDAAAARERLDTHVDEDSLVAVEKRIGDLREDWGL